MSDEPTLFDPVEGARLRDEAISQVDEHADPEWKDLAYDALLAVATRSAEFTTDDVWEHLKRTHPEAWTHEARAMGAVMRRAVLARVVARTGRVRESARPEAHRSPKAVWASLVRETPLTGGRPEFAVIEGGGETPPPPPPPPPLSEPVMGCTTGGWVWYCDEHDTHGNADSKDEAQHMGQAHSDYNLAFVDASEDGCHIVIVKAGRAATGD